MTDKASSSAAPRAARMTPVYERTLWVGVQAALYVYRTTGRPENDEQMRARAMAANFLTSMPAWMQQDDFRPPQEAEFPPDEGQHDHQEALDA